MTPEIRSRQDKWVWLFPITYAVHVAEEAWGGVGFPEWLAAFSGNRMADGLFLGLNAAGLAGMAVVVHLARRKPGFRWSLVALSALILLNAIVHAAASLLTWTYSPGTVSGLLLWAPLGGYGLLCLREETAIRYRRGLVAGLVLQALVCWAAWTGGRLLPP